MRPLFLVGLLGVVSALALAQDRTIVRTRAAVPNMSATDCRACHTAKTPTKNDPALAACPRLKIKGYHAINEAPDKLTLGKSGATYGPVTFAHRAHAHMAETGQGCISCHHYDQARPIQKCKNCHAVSRKREDLGKPDLKAAMHRQCLDCHRDWNPQGSCKTCHGKSDTSATATSKPKMPTAVSPPDRVIYETGAKEGKTVTFFHADHTKRFALACANCHQNESCRGCHDSKRVGTDNSVVNRKTAKDLTDEQAHVRCATCHTKDDCAVCHKGMTQKTIGFDHGRRTGFALNQFHVKLDCKKCHTGSGAYARVAADCESCHKGWQPKFDHAKAGIDLDEQHKDLECASCHVDKTFRRPTCSSCHDDKTWPAQKPGKVVNRDTPKK
jgi:hypothetical protein